MELNEARKALALQRFLRISGATPTPLAKARKTTRRDSLPGSPCVDPVVRRQHRSSNKDKDGGGATVGNMLRSSRSSRRLEVRAEALAAVTTPAAEAAAAAASAAAGTPTRPPVGASSFAIAQWRLQHGNAAASRAQLMQRSASSGALGKHASLFTSSRVARHKGRLFTDEHSLRRCSSVPDLRLARGLSKFRQLQTEGAKLTKFLAVSACGGVWRPWIGAKPVCC